MTPEKTDPRKSNILHDGNGAEKKAEYERVLCPHCGRLLGRRSAGASGVFQLKCTRCSHQEQRTVLVTYIFLVEIDKPPEVV